MPKSTAAPAAEAALDAPKPLTKKQEAALRIKKANAERLERLAVQKAEKKAEREKARKVAERDLNPLAKEINVRFEKASKLEHDADDHRLAASLRIAEAKNKCVFAGLNFKTWAAEHITNQSYETIRKLAAVGASDNPALALEDLRGKNKEANKKLREKTKKAATETPAEEGDFGQGEGAEKSPRATKDATVLVGIDALKHAFHSLKASDKMAFVEWAAVEIGSKLESL